LQVIITALSKSNLGDRLKFLLQLLRLNMNNHWTSTYRPDKQQTSTP